MIFTLDNITMKQLLFLIFVLLSVAEAKAQHSDLYNYMMNTVKPTHFPERNTVTITTNSRDGFSRDNQPVLVINGVEQQASQAHNITTFTSLDAYTMAQVQYIYIWRTRGDWTQKLYGGMKGSLGVIFVYTRDYIYANPLAPRIISGNAATRIVVYERP